MHGAEDLPKQPAAPVPLTVVIPCYNQAHYLSECLRSLLTQTYREWEAIVIDDASTLGDVDAVVGSFSDSRLRAIRHELNRGLAAARNTGFRAALSPFVLPLDADDMLEPSHLSKTIQRLHADPSLDCVFTDFQLFGAANRVWHYGVRDVPALLRAHWLPGAGTMIRKSLWETVGGYCEAETLRWGNEDWDFWLTAASHGFRAAHIPEPLYLYRIHDANMSAGTMAYHADAIWEYIYERHRTLFDKHRAGGRFLADGYCRAAVASWRRGERDRAYRLLRKALRQRPCLAATRLISLSLKRVLFAGRRLVQGPSKGND